MSNNEMHSPIYFFTDYDKMSDTLIYFDRSHILKFNVVLSSKNKNGDRNFFHRESQYDSTKFNAKMQLITVRRNMSFFFSIDDTEEYTNNVVINVQDIPFLKGTMEKVIPWYTNGNIYKKIDNVLQIVGEWTPQMCYFSMDKTLEFMPIVLDFGAGQMDCGVRMCINGHETYVDMNFKTFMGFYYLITNTDMYAVACNMVAYLKSEPYGVNIGTVSEDYGRRSGGNYFDRLQG